jgi:CBS-domain-containing membrane protein
VASHTPVAEIARRLLDHQISAVPVVGDDRRLLGVISKGDLIHELRQSGAVRSWWLELLASPQTWAAAYLKGYGRLARDVMTRRGR